MKRPFPYVHSITDRHGTRRHYFRRQGYETVTLRGPWGSAEFLDDYRQALAGKTAQKIQIGAGRVEPGSVAQAIALHLGSVAFATLAPSTQRAQRRILEHFRNDFGSWNLARLEYKHVDAIIAKKVAATPAAAKILLKCLRQVIKTAIKNGLLKRDPTIGIRVKLPKTDGFRIWTEEEIAQFETKHPIETRARLAFGLLLWTAQRRSDVIRMGRQHIQKDEKSEFIRVCQQKTKKVLLIEIHPELRAIINAHPAQHLTFLTTENGKPFTAAGFSNWFRDRCGEAKLPLGLSAHGLRKAALTRAANNGATGPELCALSGHGSPQEMEIYIRTANQRTMAAAAVGKFKIATSSGNPEQGFPESQRKPLKVKEEK